MPEITVCLFARLREELGEERLLVATPTPPQPCTVDTVIDSLAAQHGPRWGQVLRGDNLVMAVNHTVCARDTQLNPGDELAIFPPVTGG